MRLLPLDKSADGMASKMEDVAMKVAMVERQGGPLPMYAFSWLQSRFLFMKPNNIPQVELDNPPEEPFQNFDTFDLLQRARYFMSRGNLASAVRYVDALEGASRGAAEHWYQNANALLQTRQAAQAILAHAAAIRLKYL
ncbi:mitochondrial inner membrane protein domain-containing protein [Phthorimaea operculella]|nr:mitochondrial inner membrane protein domain-containing protein [Phthorimaea operculella]